METALILLGITLTIVILIYFGPSIIDRLKTKKVKVTTIDKTGKQNVTTLYLDQDDPLWEIVLHYKGIKSNNNV